MLNSLVTLLVDWVWPILLFVIGLGLVVFVHELGHFLVAKWVGIKVERFALGFGPNLLAFKRGETEYCLKILPLGGYVKMLGQEDFKPLDPDEKPDPRAYNAKSIGARLAVISAGVVMNVIFGALLFIVICMIGMPFPAPYVGMVMPGSPAENAAITWSAPIPRPANSNASGASQPASMPANRSIGLKAGDKIVSINGEPVSTFQDVAVKSILSGSSDKYKFEIERQIEGREPVRGTAEIGVKKTHIAGSGKVNTFGIERPQSTIFAGSEEMLTDNQIKPGDKLIAINGRPVEYNWQIDDIEKTFDGRPVNLTLLRGGAEKINLTVQPSLRNGSRFFALKDGQIVRGKIVDVDDTSFQVKLENGEEKTLKPDDFARENSDILGMIPRIKVRAVMKNSPADKAGLKPDDVIIDYGEAGDPPTMEKFHEINKAAEKEGMNISILRGGTILPPALIKPQKRNGGDPIIGIITDSDLGSCVLAGVRKNSVAANAKLEPGDRITAVNGVKVGTWVDVVSQLGNLQGQDVKLTCQARDGKEKTADLGVLTPAVYQPGDYRFDLTPALGNFQELEVTIVKYNPLDALGWGVSETWRIIVTTYASIHRLITRDVSTEAVRGPIGIGSAAIMTARHGFSRWVYLMALLSVAVAVMNFLPFPVFDGGHAFFLILEKIRGKPLPIKVMNAIQMTGLVMILGLLVAVTWQDLARAIRGIW